MKRQLTERDAEIVRRAYNGERGWEHEGSTVRGIYCNKADVCRECARVALIDQAVPFVSKP
jgi:hypothetical protein